MSESGFEINLAQDSDRDRWNAFVSGHDHASVFHLWEWGSLAEQYGRKRYYLMAQADGKVCGVLPLVLVNSVIFGRKLISLPYCEYGGPLVTTHVECLSALLAEAARVVHSEKAAYIELRGLDPAPQVNEALHQAGYEDNSHYITYNLNISRKPSEVWDSFLKRRRGSIQKAEKQGFDIAAAQREDEIRSYYQLYLLTQKKHGTPPHSYQFFKTIWELFPRDNLQVLLARHEQKIVSAIIVFRFNSTLMYWAAVSDLEHRNLNGGDLLLWKAIEAGCAGGFRNFDFGRTRPDSSVRLYKEGFGGQETKLHDYVLFLKGKKNLASPEQMRYRLMSRIWSMLPLWFTRSVGPRIVSGIGL